jgi:hypothetical protein
MATPDFLVTVDPPDLIAPAFTLLSQIPAVPFPDEKDVGTRHVSGRGGTVQTLDPANEGTYAVVDLACGIVDSVSFVVRVPELRPGQSTWANWRTDEERDALVADALNRAQSFAVARELLYGTLATAAGWPNPFLNKAPVVLTATAQKPPHALDWLTNAWHAGVTGTVGAILAEGGIIHAAPDVIRALMRNTGSVELRGTRFVEKVQGHQVVTDAGYIGANRTGPGSIDPAAQTVWMFMSPNIAIRQGGTYMTRSRNPQANTETVWAERLFHYTYETPVSGGSIPPVLAIPVDLS